jgi:hypothetical protein
MTPWQKTSQDYKLLVGKRLPQGREASGLSQRRLVTALLTA